MPLVRIDLPQSIDANTARSIGETINQGQRIEQLTKDVPGPVLLSEQTVRCLRRRRPLTCLGPLQLAGFSQPVVIYRAGSETGSESNGKD